MKCKLCQTEYEGTNCPYCGMPVLSELGGGSAGEFSAEYRKKLVARLGSLQAVVYRYERTDGGVRETEETAFLADLRRADGETVWSEAEFLRLEPEDLENGAPFALALRAEGKGFRRDFTVRMPLPGTEGTWRVGVRLEPDLTLTLLVGNPESHSRAEGIRFLAQ